MRFKLKKGRLAGTVKISGAKNSALRLQAASILTDDTIVLKNFPAGLLDAQTHNEMLERLGKSVNVEGDVLTIAKKGDTPSALEWSGRSIRNTLLILGALLAKYGEGAVPLPGGCKIGERKYDLHVMIFTAMGAEVTDDDGVLRARVKNGKRLQGADIVLPIRSTGATENGIICGTLAEGETVIWNPHIRPEILDLIDMLSSMGADITVHGQTKIVIRGTTALTGATHSVIPDNVEAITWLIAATITGGEVTLEDFPFETLEVPLIHLKHSGVLFEATGGNVCKVHGGVPEPVSISTGAYPGINSDFQPLFAIYGLCASGQSSITDLRFEGRYQYMEELARMGAKYTIQDKALLVQGGEALKGATVRAVDLRAGAALALAGWVAEGETVIEDAEQILRGYDRFADKAQKLGASIEVLE